MKSSTIIQSKKSLAGEPWFRAIFSLDLGIMGLPSGQRTSHQGVHLGRKISSDLATHRHNPDLLIRAHESVGSTYSFLGWFDEAKIHLLAAKSLYDPNRHRSQVLPYTQDPGITARIMLARTLWILGEVDEVETLVTEAIAMARELEHPYTLAFTLATASWVCSTLRDTNRTLILTEEAIMLSTKHSFEVPLAWGNVPSRLGIGRTGKGRRSSGKIGRRTLGCTESQSQSNNTYTLALLADVYLRKKQIGKV